MSGDAAWLQFGQYVHHGVRFYAEHKADAAIEGAAHLSLFHAARFLQPFEHGWTIPCVEVECGVQMIGQHARDIIRQAAARNMGESENIAQHGFHGLDIDCRGREQGLTELAITKLDVLDTFDTVKVCVAYEIDGVRTEKLPYHQSDVHRVVPVYEELPGWKTDLTQATERTHLPAEAKAYLELIEAQVGVPVSLVSTGPGRNQYLHFSQ